MAGAPLDLDQALRLGAAALRGTASKLAFDANRSERLGARDPAAIKARAQRDRIVEAIKLLEAEANRRAERKRAALLKAARVKL